MVIKRWADEKISSNGYLEQDFVRKRVIDCSKDRGSGCSDLI